MGKLHSIARTLNGAQQKRQLPTIGINLQAHTTMGGQPIKLPATLTKPSSFMDRPCEGLHILDAKGRFWNE
jgi:hypothetical protein